MTICVQKNHHSVAIVAQALFGFVSNPCWRCRLWPHVCDPTIRQLPDMLGRQLLRREHSPEQLGGSPRCRCPQMAHLCDPTIRQFLAMLGLPQPGTPKQLGTSPRCHCRRITRVCDPLIPQLTITKSLLPYRSACASRDVSTLVQKGGIESPSPESPAALFSVQTLEKGPNSCARKRRYAVAVSSPPKNATH